MANFKPTDGKELKALRVWQVSASRYTVGNYNENGSMNLVHRNGKIRYWQKFSRAMEYIRMENHLAYVTSPESETYWAS